MGRRLLTDLIVGDAWVGSFDFFVTILAIQDVCIGGPTSPSVLVLPRHETVDRKFRRGGRGFHYGLDIDSICHKHRKLSAVNVAD